MWKCEQALLDSPLINYLKFWFGNPSFPSGILAEIVTYFDWNPRGIAAKLQNKNKETKIFGFSLGVCSINILILDLKYNKFKSDSSPERFYISLFSTRNKK